MGDIILEVENISFAYPDGRQALQDISFHVEEGENFCILGANGAGKSTLLLLLAGLMEGDGSIKLFDKPLPEYGKKLWEHIGILFQEPDDQLFMPSVFEDIAFGLRNRGITGKPLEDRVSDVMRSLEISRLSSYHPHHLSLGEKRRVALAGLLALDVKLLLLDEPTLAMDGRARRGILELLASLPMTKIIATHDLTLADRLCQRGIVLNHGRIVWYGRIKEVMEDKESLEKFGLL